MKIAVFAYTRQGAQTADRILKFFQRDEIQISVPDRFRELLTSEKITVADAEFGEFFKSNDAIIFIGACGIAIRKIAPYVQDKRTDPAVLCVDELGKYVIPLLSGHIGGANALARNLAEFLGAIPVITTATDINGRFSADRWAAENGFVISDMTLAKEVSAAILERDLPIESMLPIVSDYPAGLYPGDSGAIGIFIGWERREPFAKTLRLIPKNLHLGIGCRKGTSENTIRAAILNILEQNQIDPRSIKLAASIDLKQREAGLIDYCRSVNIPISFYSADILRIVQGNFNHSDFVEQITGVDNVCERAAMVGADHLIVSKTSKNGVTVAIAAEMKGVSFG